MTYFHAKSTSGLSGAIPKIEKKDILSSTCTPLFFNVNMNTSPYPDPKGMANHYPHHTRVTLNKNETLILTPENSHLVSLTIKLGVYE